MIDDQSLLARFPADDRIIKGSPSWARVRRQADSIRGVSPVLPFKMPDVEHLMGLMSRFQAPVFAE
jgi:hypothetical protein